MVHLKDPFLDLFCSQYVNDLSEHITDCLTIQCTDDTQFVRTDSIENIEDLIRYYFKA